MEVGCGGALIKRRDRAREREVAVVRRDLERHAREAGIPEEAIVLFVGPGGPLLIARKYIGWGPRPVAMNDPAIRRRPLLARC